MNTADRSHQRLSGPHDKDPNDTTRPVAIERGVENSAGADDSLVRQMSHADESVTSDGGTEGRGVVGYLGEDGTESRLSGNPGEYDGE